MLNVSLQRVSTCRPGQLQYQPEDRVHLRNILLNLVSDLMPHLVLFSQWANRNSFGSVSAISIFCFGQNSLFWLNHHVLAQYWLKICVEIINILAETQNFGRNQHFRPKLPLSAKKKCFGRNFGFGFLVGTCFGFGVPAKILFRLPTIFLCRMT